MRPEILLCAQLGPVFPHLPNLSTGKHIVVISIGLMAVRIMVILLQTGHICQIGARGPQAMDDQGLAVPKAHPVSDTVVLGAELVGPGQGEQVVIVDDLFAGWVKEWLRGRLRVLANRKITASTELNSIFIR